jgi:hypothetical protein
MKIRLAVLDCYTQTDIYIYFAKQIGSFSQLSVANLPKALQHNQWLHSGFLTQDGFISHYYEYNWLFPGSMRRSTNHSPDYLGINAFFYVVLKLLRSRVAGRHDTTARSCRSDGTRAEHFTIHEHGFHLTIECLLTLCHTVLRFNIRQRWYFGFFNHFQNNLRYLRCF